MLMEDKLSEDWMEQISFSFPFLMSESSDCGQKSREREREVIIMVMDPALYCTWALFTLLFCCARAHLSLPAIGRWGWRGMAIWHVTIWQSGSRADTAS
jgi:hypothetical protein